MFVEKLSKEDIQEFLGDDKKLNSMFFEKASNYHDDQICINITTGNSEYDFNHKLTDMTGLSSDVKWIRFLYSKFGEEYKQWYLSEHIKIFNQ